MTDCPPTTELLIAAVSKPQLHSISEHVDACETCSAHVRELRATIGAIHSYESAAAETAHVSDDAIAAFVDGGRSELTREDLQHLARCGECQSRLASTWSALQDDSVKAELDTLDSVSAARPSSRVSLRFLGGLAAAAVATFVLLGPIRDRLGPVATQRETIDESGAPRVLTRDPVLHFGDSLRWNSVRGSDLYRVRIWTGDGTVVWTSETRDTVVAIPSSLTTGSQYLWEVKARTGWDRWVASEFVGFTLGTR